MNFSISAVVIRGLGLLLNIAGVVLVWGFGLPQRFDAETRAYIAGVEPEDRALEIARLRDMASMLGMFCLLAGLNLVAMRRGGL